MLSEAATYNAIDQRCRESRAALTDIPEGALAALEASVECPSCGSELLKTTSTAYEDARFKCQACGSQSDLVTLLPTALDRAYERRAYEAAKEGEEGPIGTCPNCSEESYSLDDDVCLLCGEGRPHKKCGICGTSLSLDESGESVCSYHRYVMDKDD